MIDRSLVRDLLALSPRSQRELAEKVGVKSSNVSAWTRGAPAIAEDKLAQLLSLLHATEEGISPGVPHVFHTSGSLANLRRIVGRIGTRLELTTLVKDGADPLEWRAMKIAAANKYAMFGDGYRIVVLHSANAVDPEDFESMSPEHMPNVEWSGGDPTSAVIAVKPALLDRIDRGGPVSRAEFDAMLGGRGEPSWHDIRQEVEAAGMSVGEVLALVRKATVRRRK